VLGVGADWAALCLVSDGIQYDGFDVFRLRDAAEVESPAPHHAFIERALELRSDPRPESPSLELSDTASMIRSAGAAFPIVTIHLDTRQANSIALRVAPNVTGIEMPTTATSMSKFSCAGFCRIVTVSAFAHAIGYVVCLCTEK